MGAFGPLRFPKVSSHTDSHVPGYLVPPPSTSLRGCDFFDSAQKAILKTKVLGRSKAHKSKKVTNSQGRLYGTRGMLGGGLTRHSRVCVRTVPRRWRSTILFHFPQRCRAGLTNSAAPRLDYGCVWTTALPESEFSHRLSRASMKEACSVKFAMMRTSFYTCWASLCRPLRLLSGQALPGLGHGDPQGRSDAHKRMSTEPNQF